MRCFWGVWRTKAGKRAKPELRDVVEEQQPSLKDQTQPNILNLRRRRGRKEKERESQEQSPKSTTIIVRKSRTLLTSEPFEENHDDFSSFHRWELPRNWQKKSPRESKEHLEKLELSQPPTKPSPRWRVWLKSISKGKPRRLSPLTLKAKLQRAGRKVSKLGSKITNEEGNPQSIRSISSLAAQPPSKCLPRYLSRPDLHGLFRLNPIPNDKLPPGPWLFDIVALHGIKAMPSRRGRTRTGISG